MSDYDAMDAYADDEEPVLPTGKLSATVLILVIAAGAAFTAALIAFQHGWIK